MPKFVPSSPKEGDVITKESITDNTDALEEIDFSLDQENFREEGLDRRVFYPQTAAKRASVNVSANGLTGTNQLLSREQQWTLVRFREDQTSSGHIYPKLQIDWDPERDTHCVIRCSFEATNRLDMSGIELRPDDYWEFGLLIIPPDQPYPGSIASTDVFMTGRGVWPYQRVSLSPAFRDEAWKGNTNFNESFEDKVTGHENMGNITSSEFETAHTAFQTSAAASSNIKMWEPIGEDEFFDHYPRGEWFQHGYDRHANWTQSFTLVALASSLRQRGFSHPPNTSRWDKSGQARVYVVYRCKLPSLPPGSTTGDGKATITALRLSAMTYRR